MAKLDQDIAELDLYPIAYTLAKRIGWSLGEIEKGISEYRIFLQSIRKTPHSLAPTKLMDEVWHTHILDTELYQQQCHQLFGQYIHHFPYSGVLNAKEAELQLDRQIKSEEIFDSLRN